MPTIRLSTLNISEIVVIAAAREVVSCWPIAIDAWRSVSGHRDELCRFASRARTVNEFCVDPLAEVVRTMLGPVHLTTTMRPARSANGMVRPRSEPYVGLIGSGKGYRA